MLKGALIGCGFFAQNHLHAWRDVDDAKIVALCDCDEKRHSERPICVAGATGQCQEVAERFTVDRRRDGKDC